MTKWLSLSSVFLILLSLLLWFFNAAPLQRDTPRNLPWILPDYRLAKTHWEVGIDGRIHTRVEHFFLENISPQMVAWFYQQLPISTVQLQGVTYPLYHIFHPTEHGVIGVKVWIFKGEVFEKPEIKPVAEKEAAAGGAR